MKVCIYLIGTAYCISYCSKNDREEEEGEEGKE